MINVNGFNVTSFYHPYKPGIVYFCYETAKEIYVPSYQVRKANADPLYEEQLINEIAQNLLDTKPTT